MDLRRSWLKKITERTNALFNDNHVEFYSEYGFYKVVIFNANYEDDPIKLSGIAQMIFQEIKRDPNVTRIQFQKN